MSARARTQSSASIHRVFRRFRCARRCVPAARVPNSSPYGLAGRLQARGRSAPSRPHLWWQRCCRQLRRLRPLTRGLEAVAQIALSDQFLEDGLALQQRQRCEGASRLFGKAVGHTHTQAGSPSYPGLVFSALFRYADCGLSPWPPSARLVRISVRFQLHRWLQFYSDRRAISDKTVGPNQVWVDSKRTWVDLYSEIISIVRGVTVVSDCQRRR